MLNRRKAIQLLSASAAAFVIPTPNIFAQANESESASASFTYCLNMATIRGHKLGFIKELEVAAKGGFRSVEIWIDSLQQYLDSGGTVKEAANKMKALGITAENAIGFAKWIVDDETVRSQAIEQLKKEMDLLAAIGCKRIAAPPMGATDATSFDLLEAARRYRIILELGDKSGVVPHLEVWGFSRTLSKASEAMLVAMEAGHPSAKILLDVYHLYKGGSSVETLPMIGKSTVELIHMNDYPAIDRTKITDGDRVHPGDGIAPIKTILNALKKPNQPLILSEEVFNKKYYEQDPVEVVKTAMAKMKAAVSGL